MMATVKRSYPGGRRNGPRAGRTTRITVNGETWDVPRGFGAAYSRCAGAELEPETIRDILSLVGYTAELSTIEAWPLRKRVEAEVYAASVHMRASDNPTPVPPKPEWMGEPWKGPREGEEGTLWESPGLTVLT